MTVTQAITRSAALTGQALSGDAPVRWLSELDGQLALTFYRADGWTPYDPTGDLDTALLVPHPWDGLYIHRLAAMTYFTNGEYDRYENERVMCEKTLADFRAYMQRSHARKCQPGFPLPEREGGTTE